MISTSVKLIPDPTELYPDSDGRRMAENTKQYRWIAIFKNGIDSIIGPLANVMSAADNLIYAVEGRPKIRAISAGRLPGEVISTTTWGKIPPSFQT